MQIQKQILFQFLRDQTKKSSQLCSSIAQLQMNVLMNDYHAVVVQDDDWVRDRVVADRSSEQTSVTQNDKWDSSTVDQKSMTLSLQQLLQLLNVADLDLLHTVSKQSELHAVNHVAQKRSIKMSA